MLPSAPVRLAGIVFDLDGTLVDSRPDLASAVNATRACLGLAPLPVEAVTAMVGEGARTLLRRALPAGVTGEAFEAALAIFLDLYYDCCLEQTRPYAGIPQAIDALVGRHRLAVLTNKPERHSRKVLAGLGLLEPFAIVIGGDTFPTRKPDPAGVLDIAGRWGAAPAELLLVGDSRIDAETARAAGSRLALVEWGFAAVAPLLSPGDWHVRRPAELALATA